MKDELTEVLILLFDEKNRLAAFLERILSTEVLHSNWNVAPLTIHFLTPVNRWRQWRVVGLTPFSGVTRLLAKSSPPASRPLVSTTSSLW